MSRSYKMAMGLTLCSFLFLGFQNCGRLAYVDSQATPSTSASQDEPVQAPAPAPPLQISSTVSVLAPSATTKLTVVGGTPPYVFSLVSGPATIDNTGVITGQELASGGTSGSAILRVTDSKNISSTITLTIGTIPTTTTNTNIQAGSITYTATGAYQFTVPSFNTMTVRIWGAGGGGGSCSVNKITGQPGGASIFASLIAMGGAGGGGGYEVFGPAGLGQPGAGGTINTMGMNGASSTYSGGAGGTAPNGGAGGTGGAIGYGTGFPGQEPGGGGGGSGGIDAAQGGGGGGASGAFVERTYLVTQLTVGSSITVQVGAGGAPGADLGSGGSGAAGRVEVSWR